MFLVLPKDYNEGYYRGLWHHKNGIKTESIEQVDDVFYMTDIFLVKLLNI
jgi:hypothetical protein